MYKSAGFSSKCQFPEDSQLIEDLLNRLPTVSAISIVVIIAQVVAVLVVV
jgi:hypothetical protein